MKTRILVTGVAAVAVLAFAASALAVVGGTPDNGHHPYAGAAVVVVGPGPGQTELCSGALVGPTTFVTAAHCIVPGFPVFVSMSDQFAGPQDVGQGFVHPLYTVGSTGLSSSDRDDVAVVKLAFPLPGPYAQLPAPNYTDTLPNNQAVDVVGYGLPTPGLKTTATAKIIPGGGKTAAWFLKISSGTMCEGDSGGPIVQSGTNIALAITSYGPAANCAAVGYAQRLDTPEVLSFINSFR